MRGKAHFVIIRKVLNCQPRYPYACVYWNIYITLYVLTNMIHNGYTWNIFAEGPSSNTCNNSVLNLNMSN